MNKKDVLVIDDDEKLCVSIHDTLQIKGYRSTTRYNVHDSIELLKKRVFEVALIDMKMPREDGRVVLAYLKEVLPYTQSAVISGHDYYEESVRQFGEGVYGFYEKPLRGQSLPEIVEGAIKKQESIQRKEKLYFEFIHNDEKITIYDPFSEIPLSLIKELSFQNYEAVMSGLYTLIGKKYGKWIDSLFEACSTNNVVICKGELVSTDALQDNEIDNIEMQKDAVCYIFIKSELVEEVKSSNWGQEERPSNSPSSSQELEMLKGQYHLNYPTIPILIANKTWTEEEISKKQIELNADFDTGNPYLLCFNSAYIQCLMYQGQRHPKLRYETHLGRKYTYCYMEVKIGLIDGDNNKEYEVFVGRFISDWESSPFMLLNNSREAFVGRALWTKLNFLLNLDPGNNGTSYISVGT